MGSRGSFRCTLVFICVLTAVGLVGVGTASARVVKVTMEKCQRAPSLPAEVELACGKMAFYGGLGKVTWARNHGLGEDLRWSGFDRQASPTTRALSVGQHLMTRGTHWLSEARARLHPPAPIIAHEALWRCIAGYPGARTDGRTGESGGSTSASNGSHFNILQMTDPWGSDFHPIGQSAETVMLVAESQYRASGYSSAWLYQQWAATVGNCMGFAE